MSDLPIIVAEWRRNSREVIRAQISEFNGCAVVDLRSWYSEDGELKPGRSGITLSVRHLPALAEAMAKALASARALGFLHDEELQPRDRTNAERQKRYRERKRNGERDSVTAADDRNGDDA